MKIDETYNVIDFGAIADGVSMCTQAAVDFPTPYGIVHIRHEKQGDKVVSTWAAPKEVKVIR